METAQAGDYATLRSLLIHDVVIMPPDEPWILGAEQLEQMYRHMEEVTSDLDIPEYPFDSKEVTITGECAVEWGDYSWCQSNEK